MSNRRCPKNKRDYESRPSPTQSMKRRGLKYIWKEVKNNPNLYCWLPVKSKSLNPNNISFEDINVQDIPPPPISWETIEQRATEADLMKEKYLKKLDSIDKYNQGIVTEKKKSQTLSEKISKKKSS